MAKKTIKINHIAKMEGHTGFVAHILDGKVTKAKVATIEGARLIEGVLIGRHYQEAPMITGRICGVCPIVHFLSSIQAIEKAFNVKVTQQTVILRKMIEWAQIIHSHALHLFFLSLPDFFDIENDLNFIKKYPKETEATIRVRQFAIDLAKVIGGRTVMPVSLEVGGFKKLPDISEIQKLIKNYNSLLEDTLLLGNFTKKIKIPKFERKTEFAALYNKSEYEILKGDIKTFNGDIYKIKDFYKQIEELHQRFDKVVRTNYLGEPYFVGALARVMVNFDLLNPQAKKLWISSGIKIPSYNTFHNVFAQAVEIVHGLEEIKKLIKCLGKIDQKNLKVKYTTKAGEGYGACEAPRGLLIDYYKLDKNGIIKDVNIITPTAQFLANLDADLKEYLPNFYKLPISQRRKKIRTLIRAYDPCISCATH